MRSPTPSKRTFLLAGITGGIGSGKTAVCDMLAARGRTVLSADRMAREISERDPHVVRAIISEFGPRAYNPDGTLHAAWLAPIVFGSPQRRRRMNAIVHPAVFAALERALRSLAPEARRPYVCVEAALIFESGLDRRMDVVVTVEAPLTLRMERVVARDGVTPRDVRNRMRAQLSSADRQRRAHVVLRNDASLDLLRERVSTLDSLLQALSPSRGRARGRETV